MNKNQKITIAIDDSWKSPIMGSYWVGIVGVTTDQKRKFGKLKVKDSKKLSRADIEKIVRYTINGISHLDGIPISPRMIDSSLSDGEYNMDSIFVHAVLELINRIPQFWDNRIIIDNPYSHKSTFIEELNEAIQNKAENLLTVDISPDGWVIENHADSKYWECSLASIHAKHWSNMELDKIRATYGDFGSGTPGDQKTIDFIKNNPLNPHIRRSWKTYSELVDSGEIALPEEVDEEAEFEE